jgi:hypothetical protein
MATITPAQPCLQNACSPPERQKSKRKSAGQGDRHRDGRPTCDKRNATSWMVREGFSEEETFELV